MVHRSREKDYARRALALLQLWETRGNVSEVAQRLRAARSSVHRWRRLYERYGEEGLRSQARGRRDGKATQEVLALLEAVGQSGPARAGLPAFAVEFATAGH